MLALVGVLGKLQLTGQNPTCQLLPVCIWGSAKTLVLSYFICKMRILTVCATKALVEHLVRLVHTKCLVSAVFALTKSEIR